MSVALIRTLADALRAVQVANDKTKEEVLFFLLLNNCCLTILRIVFLVSIEQNG